MDNNRGSVIENSVTSPSCTGSGATSAAPRSLSDIESLENPYPLYAWMRHKQPVYCLADQDLWVVSRYDDCMYVLAHPELFSSREAISSMHAFRRSPEAIGILRRSPGYPRPRTLHAADPPDHTRYRRIMNRAFAPARTVKELTPRIVELTDELIGAFVAVGRCEFIGELASPLSIRVIASIMDVPLDESDRLKVWLDDLDSVIGVNTPEERLVPAAGSALEFQEYFVAKLEQRRREPRDDLLGRLVNLLNDEEALEPPELLDLITQITVGGYKTTMSLLGNAAYCIATTAGLIDRLKADPRLIRNLIEETLRLETVIQGQFRISTEDVMIGPTCVPAGAKIMVLFASGNRDENHFDDNFDLDRNWRVPHLAFGHGIHACIGQSLARREGHIVVERLIQRLPDLRVDPDFPPIYDRLFDFRGMTELHVRFAGESRSVAAKC